MKRLVVFTAKAVPTLFLAGCGLAYGLAYGEAWRRERRRLKIKGFGL